MLAALKGFCSPLYFFHPPSSAPHSTHIHPSTPFAKLTLPFAFFLSKKRMISPPEPRKHFSCVKRRDSKGLFSFFPDILADMAVACPYSLAFLTFYCFLSLSLSFSV